MANIKSAKKRVLTSERNRVRNHAYKSAVRTAIKRVLESVGKTESTADALQETLGKAYSMIDRAVLKGIMHKNTGGRYKSRLTRLVTQHGAA